MKRNIVLVFVLLMAVSMVGVATGCGSSSSSSQAGVYALKTDPKQVITLSSNGKFKVVQPGMTITGTWKAAGGKLTLTPTNPKDLQPLNVTIKGNTITDTNGDKWTKN